MHLRFPIFRTASLLAGLILLRASTMAADSGVEFFENKIRPILAEHCYECHSQKAASLKGELYLDSKDGVLQGGDKGPVVVSGNPDASLLIRAVRHTDPKLQMPYKKSKLSDSQIADLEAWVKMGAPDPRTEVAKPLTGQARILSEAKTHWSYQPVRMPEPPKVKDKRWVTNPIDQFILAKLEANNMKPALEADRRTLIRRVTMDLTGLPPTFAEVEAFVNDRSKDAYSKLIDRLLDSKAYGERWARHWLDIARYADSMGYAAGGVERRFPYSYTYRDYVIRAFNDDVPYDQFIKEQLAADFLVKDDKRALAAMGFLTLGRHFLGNQNDVIDDRIDVITRGLMGVTAQCARCHDHKFDPVSMRDYYALYGVFASSTEPGEKPLLGIPPDPKENEAYLAERKKREDDLNNFRQSEIIKAMADVRKRTGDYLLAVHDASLIKDRRQALKLIQSRKLDDIPVARWKAYLDGLAKKDDPIFTPWIAFDALPEKEFSAKAAELSKKFSANADGKLHSSVAKLFAGEPPKDLKNVSERYGKLFADIEKQWVDALKKATDAKAQAPSALPDANDEKLRQALYADWSPANVPENQRNNLLDGAGPKLRELQAKITRLDATHPGAPARAMSMVDGNPHNVRIMLRGQPGNNGPEAKRSFIEALSKPDAQPFTKGSGRLELAESIASRDNPLTSRVLVNRVWMYHFGEAFVRTTSDFGIRTEKPVQAGLLDWLSAQFMEQGWSLKKLHKLILTSSAYRMSSSTDPKRVTEYTQRDPNNTLLWHQSRQRLDYESMRDSLLFVAGRLDSKPAGQPVELWKEPFSTKRSVYGFIDRQNLPGVFRAFDFANPDTSSARRLNTTVPQQALFLMNNPFVIEQSKALLERADVKETGSDESKIRALYQIVVQRDPSKDELKMASAFVSSQTPEAAETEVPMWQYGYGGLDEKSGHLKRFTAFKHFTGSAWQSGSKLPNDRTGWVSLHRQGGHPGDNPDFMAVRRWTAPKDGVIAIEGELSHRQAAGNGVRGRIVSSRSGILGDATAQNGSSNLKVERVGVLKGDTIDFVADSRDDTNNDSFNWTVQVKYLDGGESLAWNSEKDFSGPAAPKVEPLNGWQRFAQVLLLSNEFSFLD